MYEVSFNPHTLLHVFNKTSIESTASSYRPEQNGPPGVTRNLIRENNKFEAIHQDEVNAREEWQMWLLHKHVLGKN